MNNFDYVLGIKDALTQMDEHIADSIRRNGGAVTHLQVLNVFNDILAKLHWEKQEAIQALKVWETPAQTEECVDCEEPNWEELAQMLFPNVTIIKRGRV